MKYRIIGTDHPAKFSESNRGRRIVCKTTGKVHPVPISHEGEKYYHLSKNDVHDFVLKKDYEII